MAISAIVNPRASYSILNDPDLSELNPPRFTADGRPENVAQQTRLRLHHTIDELTADEIQQIAEKAEAHNQSGQRVFLEVSYGEPIGATDAALLFKKSGVDITAIYTFYKDEEEGRDKRLLRELRRIEYLEKVVMRQLETTDKANSMSVVQGMIRSSGAFIKGLQGLFKQVEKLSSAIERGLKNKNEMPTTEQKTTAIQTLKTELGKLQPTSAAHIAVKNMVQQQLGQLQKNIVMPAITARAETKSALTHGTTPVSKIDMTARTSNDGTSTAQTNTPRISVLTAPITTQSVERIATQLSTRPAVQAPSATLLRTSLHIVARNPAIERGIERGAAASVSRSAFTVVNSAAGQRVINAFTRNVPTPTTAPATSVLRSEPISIPAVNTTAPLTIPVLATITLPTAILTVTASPLIATPVQTQITPIQNLSSQPQTAQVASTQNTHILPAQNAIPAIQTPTPLIPTRNIIGAMAHTAATEEKQPTLPHAAMPPITTSLVGQTTVPIQTTITNSADNGIAQTPPTTIQIKTGQAVTTPANNTHTTVEAANPQRPTNKQDNIHQDEAQNLKSTTALLGKLQPDKDEKKEAFKANAKSACEACTSKDCANCGVKTSTLFGVKTTSIPILRHVPEVMVDKAKKMFGINAGKCAGCGGGDCASCMRTTAVVADKKSVNSKFAALQSTPSPK